MNYRRSRADLRSIETFPFFLGAVMPRFPSSVSTNSPTQPPKLSRLLGCLVRLEVECEREGPCEEGEDNSFVSRERGSRPTWVLFLSSLFLPFTLTDLFPFSHRAQVLGSFLRSSFRAVASSISLSEPFFSLLPPSLFAVLFPFSHEKVPPYAFADSGFVLHLSSRMGLVHYQFISSHFSLEINQCSSPSLLALVEFELTLSLPSHPQVLSGERFDCPLLENRLATTSREFTVVALVCESRRMIDDELTPRLSIL